MHRFVAIFCHFLLTCFLVHCTSVSFYRCQAKEYTPKHFQVALNGCPEGKKVRAIVRMYTSGKNQELSLGTFSGRYISFLISPEWQRRHEKDTVRVFVIPSIDGSAPPEATCSGISQELTLEQILSHSSDNALERELSEDEQAKAYPLQVTWHSFLKEQTVLYRDADGGIMETKGWAVEAKVPGPMWDKFREMEPQFCYDIRGSEKQTEPLSFRVYSGLEYFINMNHVYVGQPYQSPAIAAADLVKLSRWEPQCQLPRVFFRLLDSKTKRIPSVFTQGEYEGQPFLLVSPKEDTPSQGMVEIPISSIRGGATMSGEKMAQYLGWGKVYFHAVMRKDYNTRATIPFFKPVTTFHKFDPKKKVHNIDILVEPVGEDTVLTPTTTISVTDKNSGKAINGVAVYTLAPPHQRINVKKPLPLKPGKHQLLFYAEGYCLLEQEVTVQNKGKHSVNVALEPLPAPVILAFNGPADAPADKLQLKFRYDNYPFLGTLKLTRVNWKDGTSAVPEALEQNIYPKLTLDNGRGEMSVAIDGRQPFTLCANAMPKPKPGMRSGSQELPLLVFRHPKGAPECTRAELKMPTCVEWKGKIDLKAVGADGVIVIWARKLDGIPDAPVAGATKTDDGECHAFLEPGQTYGRYMMLMGKDHKGQDACRSLPPYTVPVDAKELPEETLTPGPAGSGVPVRNKIGGWMF